MTKKIPFRIKTLVFIGSVGGLLMIALLVFRAAGLIRPFSVPTGAMSPTISPGDHVVMEGFSYLKRAPQNGDVVVFRTAGIQDPRMPDDQFYVKRVAGSPKDVLQIMDGKLYVNGRHMPLINGNGETVVYGQVPMGSYLSTSNETVTVPEHYYFVIGDNTTNSFDSRSWGFLPAENILGRVVLRYWPAARVGAIK